MKKLTREESEALMSEDNSQLPKEDIQRVNAFQRKAIRDFPPLPIDGMIVYGDTGNDD